MAYVPFEQDLSAPRARSLLHVVEAGNMVATHVLLVEVGRVGWWCECSV